MGGQTLRARTLGAMRPLVARVRPLDDALTRVQLWFRRRSRSGAFDESAFVVPDGLIGPDEPPLPPASLRHLVSGTADPVDFIVTGKRHAAAIAAASEEAGQPFGPGLTVADVGCGCGRILRHWTPTGARLLAGDVNTALASWVDTNLDAEVFPIDRRPPTGLADATVDVLVAYSVLTHLPVREQQGWITDWGRAVRPGGLLIVSTHGRSRRPELRAGERRRFDAGDPVVRHRVAQGDNLCAAFMPPEAAPQVFGALEIVDHQEPASDQPWDQDLWTLRRAAR